MHGSQWKLLASPNARSRWNIADKQMKTFCALGDKIAHKRGFSTQIG